MKCEIIRDLLPLYIEDLCSPESREEVEAHLKQCVDCQREYKELSQEYQNAIDNQGVEEFLEEKDLFEKSKNAIEVSFADRIISKIFAILLWLGVIGNVLMLILVFIFYQYRYPSLALNESGSGVCILIFPFLATFVALLGKTAMKRKKGKFCSRALLIAMIPAIFLSSVGTLGFLIIPPISSSTSNVENYLEFDGGVEEFEKVVKEFCPNEIPEKATQIKYDYDRYSTFLNDRAEMEVSWKLPSEEYERVKNEALSVKEKIVCPKWVKIDFEYDDSQQKVVYRVFLDKNY